MLEPGFLVVAPAAQVPSWVSITALVVSILSALFTGISLILTYQRDRREKERDRKKVNIVSSIDNHFIAIGTGISTPVYRCTMTNIGVPGVEIRRVGLRSHRSAGVEIPLELAHGEERRALAQGDSQIWEKDLKELQASFSGSGSLKVVAVATDTVGDQYVQDTSKSLPIPLGD